MKYLLDEIKGCVWAGGTHRLRRDFVGGPIRLRKGSDNSEIDVPACGKSVCETTINKHLNVTLVNLLESYGNLQADSNIDGLADGYILTNSPTSLSVSNGIQTFTPL